MEPQTVSLVITAAAGFGGALVGAGATIATARLQHGHAIKLELAKETRTRGIQAAAQCEALFAQFTAAVMRMTPLSSEAVPMEQVDSARRQANDANQGLGNQLLYLPEEWRERLENYRDVLQWAKDLAGPDSETISYYYTSAYAIAFLTMEDGRRNIAAFMTGADPPPTSPFYIEITAALKELYKDMEEKYPFMRGESSETEQRWLDAHPDVARALAERRSPRRRWWQRRRAEGAS